MLGFRVWCPGYSVKPGKMEYYDSAFDDEQHFLLRADGTLVMACAYYPAPDSFAPMQSTGLKDMTGKEIFEGDIIMVGQPDGDYRPEIVLRCESIPQIYNLLKGRYRNHPFTIIGNAYENPELLEGI
jgi:hypothetical protein